MPERKPPPPTISREIEQLVDSYSGRVIDAVRWILGFIEAELLNLSPEEQGQFLFAVGLYCAHFMGRGPLRYDPDSGRGEELARRRPKNGGAPREKQP